MENSEIIDITPVEEKKELTSDEKNMALLVHLSPLAVGFIGPLVIYLMKKDESDFIKEHATEALNFQISLTVYFMILGVGSFVTFGLGVFLAIPLIFVLGIVALVGTIKSAMKASNGEMTSYPLNIKFIK